MTNKKLSLLLVTILGLSLAACGAFRAAAAKQNYINHQMQGYVYEKPLAEVWPGARTLLFESNYQVRDTGEGATTLETEWKYDEQGNSSRYLVQGVPVEGGCKILFTRQGKSAKGTGSASSTRDFEMEWNLVRATDPGRAAQIEQDANAEGDAARKG